MEALIASPVPRFGLLLSKYVAVVSVASLTALANLGAMWITLTATGLGQLLLGESGFSLALVGLLLPLLVIFASFFSAILLGLCSFAKSFKEAQAYLIPIMLLSLAPGVLSLMPGVRLSWTLACVPLVNIVLLARDLLTGLVNPALGGANNTVLPKSNQPGTPVLSIAVCRIFQFLLWQQTECQYRSRTACGVDVDFSCAFMIFNFGNFCWLVIGSNQYSLS
jgi:hypothetical protein